MYKEQVERFVEEQREAAMGQRKALLSRPLIAEKKMLAEVILPVLRSFDGLVLEYELISQTGVKIYIDVFFIPLRLGMESEGFVGHAENITRDRFDFEKARVRSFTSNGYRLVPFSWDELDKKPEACRRSFAEIVGFYSTAKESELLKLPVYWRELIRYGVVLGRPIRLQDAMFCMQLGETAAAKVLKQMREQELLRPVGKGSLRYHEHLLTERAMNFLAMM